MMTTTCFRQYIHTYINFTAGLDKVFRFSIFIDAKAMMIAIFHPYAFISFRMHTYIFYLRHLFTEHSHLIYIITVYDARRLSFTTYIHY